MSHRRAWYSVRRWYTHSIMKGWMLPLLVTGMVVAAVPADAQVRLTIADGYVSLDAKDATVRQILAEWARVGQTRIVNGERVVGSPVTLQLTHVPEGEALNIVLRSVSGYMAAPRATEVPNASRFDRILVMPTSTPPRVTTPPPAQAAFAPVPMPAAEDVDVDEPPMPPGAAPGQRGPVFPPQFPGAAGQFPGAAPRTQAPFPPAAGQPFQPSAQPMPVQNDTTPTTTPGVMPVGVATPGMVVAPPPVPGQQPQSIPAPDSPR
jgi:hypothetical protein